MPRVIPDDGPKNARIAVVAEMDATFEEAQGKHLVGPSGGKWMSWLHEVGLQRSDCYVTNVVPFRANKQNKIALVPKDEVEHWTHRLHERIAELTDPWLIVPMGNAALKAFTGMPGISRRRGSIYQYIDRRGRPIKVIGTIHPAGVFQQPKFEKRCILDWRRIAGDVQFRDLRLPEREHFIKPTLSDLHDYLYQAATEANLLVYDIETPRESIMKPTVLKSGKPGKPKRTLGAARIVCIGFAYMPNFSITVPTTLSYWRDENSLADAWGVIRALLALPCEKGAQNAYTFDNPWLADYGFRVRNFRWDSLSLHHAFDSLDEHTLHYMASIDTREPYWKDEAKDPDEISKWTANLDQFHTYNGKDTAVTWELIDTYVSRHHAAGSLGFCKAMYEDLYQPLLDLMRGGIGVNDKLRRQRYARLQANCITIQQRLSEIAGEPLYGPKSLSSTKLQKFLYETLKLPLRRDRKTGRPTTKEVVVRKLTLQFPAKLGELPNDLYGRPVSDVAGVGPLILRHRRDDILSKFYADARVDADQRIRCTYKISTSTWRLASSKNWRRTGTNLQNQDREARDAFIPDPGCIFIEEDLSQAEDRVVRMLTRSPRQIEIARAQPWKLDVHRRAATVVFRIPSDKVTSEQRYFGKRTNHASNYGLRGLKFSEELLKDGYVRDPDECDHMIDSLLQEDHEKLDWQRDVRQRILRDRCLTNSWGCVVDFTYQRLNDDLYRVGYAFEPQSEVGILLNRWGFVPLSNFLREKREREGWIAAINVQGHDSLLISTPPEHAWEIHSFVRASLERPRVYRGNELTIPIETKAGTTWRCEREWKQPPSREEFEAVVYELYEKTRS